MATYVLLANYTDQGIRNAGDSPKRAEAFKEMAQAKGVTVKDMYWTLGQHDMVVIAEAADDMAISATMLSLAKLGNVRSQTLRAFSAAEFGSILKKT